MTNKLKSICLRREEVQALQRDGKATVARVVKIPSGYNTVEVCGWVESELAFGRDGACHCVEAICPLGRVGERRWVREKAKLSAMWGSRGCNEKVQLEYDAAGNGWRGRVASFYRDDSGSYGFRVWLPAARMPRWASRYTIEVESVAAEQRDDVWHWVAVLKLVEEAAC